jgi:hypothetical protein
MKKEDKIWKRKKTENPATAKKEEESKRHAVTIRPPSSTGTNY